MLRNWQRFVKMSHAQQNFVLKLNTYIDYRYTKLTKEPSKNKAITQVLLLPQSTRRGALPPPS